MVLYPDACKFLTIRCPGISVNKFRTDLPPNFQVTPSAHFQMALPRVDGLDLRSLQVVCDVSTSTSTGGPYVLPRYGAQMLMESSTLCVAGQTFGGQSNQYYNIWNHIKQDYSAGSTDQPKMSVYGGAGDVPALASTAGSSYTTDVNGTQTPPALTAYTSASWAGSAVTTPLAYGANQIGANGLYTNGLPQVIEVFNETMETAEPEVLPTVLMADAYIDIGMGTANALIGPAGGTPSYVMGNLSMQGTVYGFDEDWRRVHYTYLQGGNHYSIPFKNIMGFAGGAPLSTPSCTLNFQVSSASLDMLVACFLDGQYRAAPGPVSSPGNTSKYFTLGKGTGIKKLNWLLNGQTVPSFNVGPKHAWGQTVTDMNLWGAGRGTYKNLNSYQNYLRNWFVYAMSTSLPFKENMLRAVSGRDLRNQNAQLSLVVQDDPTVTGGSVNTGETFSTIPLVFAVTTAEMLLFAGGQCTLRI